MRRTLTLTKSDKYGVDTSIIVSYRGKELGVFSCFLARHFKMKAGRRYRVTIVKGSTYLISARSSGECEICTVETKENEKNEYTYLGGICSGRFQKLFFTPKQKRKEDLYDITVKEVIK